MCACRSEQGSSDRLSGYLHASAVVASARELPLHHPAISVGHLIIETVICHRYLSWPCLLTPETSASESDTTKSGSSSLAPGVDDGISILDVMDQPFLNRLGVRRQGAAVNYGQLRAKFHPGSWRVAQLPSPPKLYAPGQGYRWPCFKLYRHAYAQERNDCLLVFSQSGSCSLLVMTGEQQSNHADWKLSHFNLGYRKVINSNRHPTMNTLSQNSNSEPSRQMKLLSRAWTLVLFALPECCNLPWFMINWLPN